MQRNKEGYMWTDITKTENKKIAKNIKKTKSWFFEENTKIQTSGKTNQGKMVIQINKIRNKKMK